MRGAKGLIVVLGLVMPLAAQRVSADEARRVLQQHDCQLSLPGEAVAGSGSQARRDDERGGSGLRIAFGTGGVGLATAAMWAGVGLAIAAVVVVALRARGSGVAVAPAAKPRVVTEQDGAVPSPPAGDECDRLAAAGRFAEAVHGLLLRAFAALAQRVGVLPPHATGRELLRLGKARALAVEPLRQLVDASERVHFGGRAADRGLYDDLRQQLSRWEAACRDAK